MRENPRTCFCFQPSTRSISFVDKFDRRTSSRGDESSPRHQRAPRRFDGPDESPSSSTVFVVKTWRVLRGAMNFMACRETLALLFEECDSGVVQSTVHRGCFVDAAYKVER